MHFMFNNLFPESRAIYEIMWKYTAEPVGHRWQYGACTLHGG